MDYSPFLRTRDRVRYQRRGWLYLTFARDYIGIHTVYGHRKDRQDFPQKTLGRSLNESPYPISVRKQQYWGVGGRTFHSARHGRVFTECNELEAGG